MQIIIFNLIGPVGVKKALDVGQLLLCRANWGVGGWVGLHGPLYLSLRGYGGLFCSLHHLLTVLSILL